jgi:O-antigen/teichoic acid export membrane protein
MKKKPAGPLIDTTIYYAALILNIFMGWLVAKLNTSYLDINEYGRYSFFITVLYFSRSFFGFGVFESGSRLLAVTPEHRARKQLLGTGLIFTGGFVILYSLFFILFSGASDRLFAVRIGDLCSYYAAVTGLILLHSYYVLALRGTGQIRILSLLTISPRIFYLLLLIPLVVWRRFSLIQTLNMFFIGFAISLIAASVYLRPVFKNWLNLFSRFWRDVRSYGIHLYLSNIWTEILFHADKFIISYFLSAQAMAYYGLGYTLTFPLSHFSTSLATTMFNRFAAQTRIGFRVLWVNSVFVTVSVVIFILLRRVIIIHLFSPEYLPTVDIMLPLAMAFGCSGISKPFTLFLMARGESKAIRNISILVPTVHIIIGLLVVPRYGIYGAAWTAFAIYLLDLVLFLVTYLRFIRHQPV